MTTHDPDRPKVSVVTITYNHQAYIAEALESILAQQTDFAFEVVVADDASTDATAAIVSDFAARHPGVVVPILRPTNLGIHANFVSAAAATRGDYVALCEGDDYWTDPHKLQRQADVLDARPEVSLCAHPVLRTWEGGEEPDSVWPDESERTDTSFRALLRTNFVPTNSTLSRRLEDYATLPDIMPLDWYLHLRHARGGEIAVLDEVMGVYRRHAGGVWFGAYGDPDNFWVRQAPAMAGFTDEVLGLVGDDADDLAAMEEWALWVTRLFAMHARDADDLEVARVLHDHPRFAGHLARSYAQRVDEAEWHQAKLEERTAEAAKLQRRLRRSRRKVRRLKAASRKAGTSVEEQRRRRWPF